MVSTFGVVFDPDLGCFDWTKFRAMARLHKKTDESLQKYLCAFAAMSRRVCRLPPKEGGQKLTCTRTYAGSHSLTHSDLYNATHARVWFCLRTARCHPRVGLVIKTRENSKEKQTPSRTSVADLLDYLCK